MDHVTFESLGVSGPLLAALTKKGFEEPTPIQALAIPRLISGSGSVVAKARTGTGKTAAFGIPLVQLIDGPAKKPQALVLVPTRELAIQVCGEIMSFRSGEFPRVAPIYGGSGYGDQFRRLKTGVEIVVGTPGRVLDHLDRGSLDLSDLRFLVLDEGDEMLDMGFLEDIEKVFRMASPKRRVLIFSATMPREILRVASEHIGDYETLADESTAVEENLTEQIWIEVNEGDKLEALRRIIDLEDEFYGIVFTATKVDADELSRKLNQSGIDSEALHGDLSQNEREKVLGRFREKQTRVLTATDVAARGIDVEKISHVVNFSLPHDPDSYTHRIGRTGRAGNSGVAITFVTPQEYRRLFWIRKQHGDDLKKGAVPEVEDLMAAKRSRIFQAVAKEAETRAALDAVTRAAALPEGDGAEEAAGADQAGKDPWLTLATELLATLDPKVALAAALEAGFKGELDRDRYGEIRPMVPGSKMAARLYVGAGRKDGVTKKDIANLVAELSGLPERLVNGVELYEACSFVNIPFDAAERTITAARDRGGIPSVRKATPKGDQGGRPFRPDGKFHRDGPGGYKGRPNSDGPRKPYPPRKGGPRGPKPGSDR